MDHGCNRERCARGRLRKCADAARALSRLPPRAFTEAPTGFDSVTNGYLPQGPDFDTLDEDSVIPGRSFNDNRFVFEEVETNADG